MTSTQLLVTSTQLSMTSTQLSMTSTQLSVTSTQLSMASTQLSVTSIQISMTSTQLSNGITAILNGTMQHNFQCLKVASMPLEIMLMSFERCVDVIGYYVDYLMSFEWITINTTFRGTNKWFVKSTKTTLRNFQWHQKTHFSVTSTHFSMTSTQLYLASTHMSLQASGII